LHTANLSVASNTDYNTTMNQAEDVEVILGHKRRYKFHSGTLARNSTLFADMLTEPNAAKLSNRARNAGIKVRWMIELTKLPSQGDPAGRLELVVCVDPAWSTSVHFHASHLSLTRPPEGTHFYRRAC
tara:strand:+ start:16032 stop:16415 length:384 start_codon:yes stop_codon:yes gene_type:complete